MPSGALSFRLLLLSKPEELCSFFALDWPASSQRLSSRPGKGRRRRDQLRTTSQDSLPQHPHSTGLGLLAPLCLECSYLPWKRGTSNTPRGRLCASSGWTFSLLPLPRRSYLGCLWKSEAGWTPPVDLPAVELAVQSNHYCHAQKASGSHPDLEKQRARRKLYVASAICLVFMIGEIVGKVMCVS